LTIVYIVILLATGTAVGLASGLLGLGGAFIMTPVQYLIFTHMGLPVDTAIKLAFGTNLMVVLPTAASGAWRHHREGVVHWRTAIIMGVSSCIFALIGATLTTYLSGEKLKIAYGIIVLLAGIRMLIAGQPQTEREMVNNHWVWLAWAVPVGLLSGLFGIGGAVVMIPVMVLALRFKMHDAVGTSLAMMIFTSIGGIIGYIVNGLGVPGLPPYSVGYVNLPSWFILVLTSVGMAQVGAAIAHKLSGVYLKYIFVVLMFYMGLKMMGVFDWLGWPI
jgi:uncharacterized membrane protein YfcA